MSKIGEKKVLIASLKINDEEKSDSSKIYLWH